MFSEKAEITGISRDSYIYIAEAIVSIPKEGGSGKSRKTDTMNKKELAKEMSRRHSMTTEEAKRIIELIQTITEEAMERGEEVRLSGFGIFRIVDRAARTAHNPVTGEPVKVPRRKSITFKTSSRLAEKIKCS